MTVADYSTEETRCVGCGQAVPRRWLICAHRCEHCQSVRHLVDGIVRWSYDPDGVSGHRTSRLMVTEIRV